LSRRAVSLETYDGVGPIAAEWDALATRAGASPFVRPGWIAAWYSAFGLGKPLVAAVRSDGVLVAVASLEARGRTLRSAANWHTPAFDVVAETRDAARALADAVLALRPRRLELRFLDADGLALQAFRPAAVAAGYRVLTRPLQESPYVPVSGDWDDYAATLRKMLKDLARRARRLEAEHGSVSYSVETGGSGLEEALETGFELEASGWKGRRGTAIASRPETTMFYTDVARWAAERDWLRLAFLSVAGRPIAFEFDLEVDDVIYNLKPGYDEDFGRFAPGKLLAEQRIRGAFAAGARSYEFLGAAVPFKLEWTRCVRECLILQAFAPTPAGLGELAAFRLGRPAAGLALAAYRRARALGW
jgi:CelD/BcsL family acetyltransferase involved in cellulose biosynthesis